MIFKALVVLALAAGTLAVRSAQQQLPPQYIPEVWVRDSDRVIDSVKAQSSFWIKSINEKHRVAIADLTSCIFSQFGGKFADLINSTRGASGAGFTRLLNSGIDRCVRNTTDTAIIAASNVWLRFSKIIAKYNEKALLNGRPRRSAYVGEDSSSEGEDFRIDPKWYGLTLHPSRPRRDVESDDSSSDEVSPNRAKRQEIDPKWYGLTLHPSRPRRNVNSAEAISKGTTSSPIDPTTASYPDGRNSASDFERSQFTMDCKKIPHWPTLCSKITGNNDFDVTEYMDVMGAGIYIFDELFPGLGCRFDLKKRLNPKLLEHHQPDDNYRLISGCNDEDVKLAQIVIAETLRKMI